MDNISENDVEALIELIEWYRDYYHKNAVICSEMIRDLQEDPNKWYDIYDRTVDDWLE